MCTRPRNTVRGHRAADHRRGDVVEESSTSRTRSASSTKQPFQSSGSKRGSTCRHAAVLEVLGQQRKAEQQAAAGWPGSPTRAPGARAKPADASAGLERRQQRSCTARSRPRRRARSAACGGETARRRAARSANSTNSTRHAAPTPAGRLRRVMRCADAQVVHSRKRANPADRLALGDERVLDAPRVGMAERHAADHHLAVSASCSSSAMMRWNCVNAACGQVSRPRARAATITFCRNMP